MNLTELYTELCHSYYFAISAYRSFCEVYRVDRSVPSGRVDDLNTGLSRFYFYYDEYRKRGGKRKLDFINLVLLPTSISIDEDGFVLLHF